MPAVLIAGGIGITPMVSMLRWRLAARHELTLYLFHGVRNGREQAFGSVLESMATSHPAPHLHIAYRRPDGAHLTHAVLPCVASFAELAVLARAVDRLLHWAELVWVGRWLGIPGTLLIIGSTAYILLRRQRIRRGEPARLLRWHEGLAWLGSLLVLVLVPAGVHFNAILGWLAVWAMPIAVGSGLTGKFLLGRARRRLVEARQRIQGRAGAAPSSNTGCTGTA